MRKKHVWLALVLAVALIGTMVVFTACGDEGTTDTTGAGGKPVKGGTFSFYIGEPAFIDPVNGQESEGIQVINSVFDSLLAFDFKAGKLVPAAAESWESNADATVWTFKLNEDGKFHNGRKVTAADFKYAWERICNPVNESEISYHLSAVKGFQAMQDGAATELEGVKVVDDYTLEVTLEYPFADFEFVVSHPSLCPVPKEEVEKDAAAFAEKPVGNGPFMMAEPWAHDQYIKVVRFDDFYGEEAYLDGVDFKIFKDDETAFLEFKAGTLDFTVIPSGQVKAVAAEYGESADGYTVEPGKQVLLGPEVSIYYLLLNTKDEIIKNVDLRRALSLAIDRQAICDAVYEGMRVPATGIVPSGILGYLDNQWAYCKYDPEQAKELLAKAGYPNGEGLPEISIGFNSGRGHEDVMALVQANFLDIGVKSKLDGVEWAQYLDKLDAGEFQVGRLGWLADYPIMDNFLFPLFHSSSADNHSFYNNPAVDEALMAARSNPDLDSRIKAYQEVDRMIGDDAPVIPINVYRHGRVGSDRIHGFVFDNMGLANLSVVWISAAQ
jgi:ABC-type transport system substrate-binding protein